MDGMKKLKKLKQPKNFVKMNNEQDEFCRLFVTKGDTYGKAYLCYSIAYNKPIPTKINYQNEEVPDNFSQEYKVCQAASSRMLTLQKVQDRIQEYLLMKFNEQQADARISDIIQSGKDADAINAVKIFNDLRQRITKKVDVTTGGRPLANLSDEELEAMVD